MRGAREGQQAGGGFRAHTRTRTQNTHTPPRTTDNQLLLNEFLDYLDVPRSPLVERLFALYKDGEDSIGTRTHVAWHAATALPLLQAATAPTRPRPSITPTTAGFKLFTLFSWNLCTSDDTTLPLFSFCVYDTNNNGVLGA